MASRAKRKISLKQRSTSTHKSQHAATAGVALIFFAVFTMSKLKAKVRDGGKERDGGEVIRKDGKGIRGVGAGGRTR